MIPFTEQFINLHTVVVSRFFVQFLFFTIPNTSFGPAERTACHQFHLDWKYAKGSGQQFQYPAVYSITDSSSNFQRTMYVINN